MSLRVSTIGQLNNGQKMDKKWTKNELADLDHNSSKLLTMHGALHPKCINVCINQAEKEGVDCLVSTKLLALKKGILIYMSTRARSAS